MGSLVVGTIYFGLMFILAGFFLLLGLCFKSKLKEFITMAVGVLVLFIFIIPLQARLSLKIQEKREAPIKAKRQAKYEAAKAVFDEQCKKAGEKIYRTVDNVDGVMLLKVRKSKYSHENDPMFEDVLSIVEQGESSYINGFLSSLTASGAVGYMPPPINEKGYSFVDVLGDTGEIVRYVDYIGSGDNDKSKSTTIKNPLQHARYAVTYENNVDPELRKHWVAGTTIKIIDQQTDELLAEKTIFAFAHTMGNYVHGAWVDSRTSFCPEVVEQRATKNFVVTVLKPQPFMEH